jgi:hypothetical protein
LGLVVCAVDEDEVGFCHCDVVDYWMLWCSERSF